MVNSVAEQLSAQDQWQLDQLGQQTVEALSSSEQRLRKMALLN